MDGYHSDTIVIRRRFRENGNGQDASATAVHVREVEGQGRCDEGDEDGADIEEGADKGEVVERSRMEEGRGGRMLEGGYIGHVACMQQGRVL